MTARRPLLAALAALTLAAPLLGACAGEGDGEKAAPPTATLRPVAFAEIPGWADDRHAEALTALRRSCPRLTAPAAAEMRVPTSPGEIRVTPEEWRAVCAQAERAARDPRQARAFFETRFQAYAVGGEAKFTGYYEPQIRGSRVQSRRYTIPVYRKPPDLRADQPYLTRAEIEGGALRNRRLEIAWVDDPIGLFEMQVQGSGRIELAEGGSLRLGFDGTNNRPYTALGRVLVDEGAIPKDEVTWPRIRQWLQSNPTRAREIMRRNERYVFFRDTAGAGPLGAQGVALSAGRSIAVDPAFTPYGLPVWIDTERPVLNKPSESYRRLMVAQDTGAAIKGPARADIFFGAGAAAADAAGRMNAGGRFFTLVPKR